VKFSDGGKTSPHFVKKEEKKNNLCFPVTEKGKKRAPPRTRARAKPFDSYTRSIKV